MGDFIADWNPCVSPLLSSILFRGRICETPCKCSLQTGSVQSVHCTLRVLVVRRHFANVMCVYSVIISPFWLIRRTLRLYGVNEWLSFFFSIISCRIGEMHALHRWLSRRSRRLFARKCRLANEMSTVECPARVSHFSFAVASAYPLVVLCVHYTTLHYWLHHRRASRRRRRLNNL